MTKNSKETSDFYIRLLKFCEKYKDGFTYDTIMKNDDFMLTKWEEDLVKMYLDNANSNKEKQRVGKYSNYDTPFYCIKSDPYFYSEKTKYIISYDSKFKYLDYLELKEAREFSKKANKHAIKAIIIAKYTLYITIVTLSLSIFFSFWQIVKPVRIDNIQFQEMKNFISNQIDYNNRSYEKKYKN